MIIEQYDIQDFFICDIRWSAFIEPEREHNLVEPCLIDNFYVDLNKPYPYVPELTDEEIAELWKTDPFSVPMPDTHEIYKPVKRKFVRNSNGKLRWLKGILLRFTYNGRELTEIFYMDRSICSIPKYEGDNIRAILGKEICKQLE